MTTAGPWSVKGIDPKAREIAKDLARRSGLTLGEWLNQMIVDTSDGEAPPPVETRDPWAEPPVPLARGPEGAGGLGPGGFGAESFRARLQNVGRAAEAAELSRVTRALNELAGRMEAAEQRSTLAISGIDQQVMGVLSRIEDGERDAGATAARCDGALDEVRAAQERIAARLAKADAEDAPRVEAMKALENALARMASQIYEGESRARAQVAEVRQDLSGLARRVEQTEAAAEVAAGRADSAAFEAALARITERLDAAEHKTSAAVAALESSFAGLDARVKGGADVDARFAHLAAELQAGVEGDRAGMAQHLRAAADQATGDGKLDRMEAALLKLSGQVGEAEQRSAAAIDRMGHEIIRIASNMHGRMERAEGAGTEVVQRVGGEMARFADVMDQRARRADDMQAQALERLGGEIGKIAEKLTERISSSERRTAKAMTDLGEQMEGAADRLNARYDHALADVAERLRRSDERTQRRLEDLGGGPVPSHAAAPAAAAPPSAAYAPTPAPAAERDAFSGAEPESVQDLDPFASIGGEPEAQNDFDRPYDPFAALEAELARAPAPPAPRDPFPDATAAATPPYPSAQPAPFEPDARAAPDEALFAHPRAHAAPSEPPPFESAFQPGAFETGAFETGAFESDALRDDVSPADPRRLSTRDLIASARAAARDAADVRNRRGSGRSPAAAASTLAAPPLPGLSPTLAGLSPLPPETRGPFGLTLPRRRRREAGTLRTIAYASGVAVTLTVAAVGAANIASHAAEGEGDPPAAPTLTARATAPVAPTAAPGATPASTPASTLASTLAMAVTPPDTAQDTGAATAAEGAVTADGVPAAAPPSAGALDEARSIYSGAVRRLESGDAAGLADLRKAANLGLPQAQFHLANLYQDGAPGLTKDATQARVWMSRAAAGGEPRAMFNLGLDYANGEGGARDDRSAVAWFRRAADLGLRDAQFNLAVMNQDGRGAPKSAAEAYKWFTIAAGAGDAGARASAQALRPQLAPDALAAAERSAAAYRAQARVMAAATGASAPSAAG